MQVLWERGPCFVKEIIPHLPGKQTAYTTASTLIRILEQKGFVDHEAFGKAHRYFPLVSKKDYRKNLFSNYFQKYFDGSYEQLASFFAKEEKLDEAELQAFLEELNKQKPE